VIKQVDGKWCVYNADGSRSFGCFDSEDLAKQRLAQVERFSECDMIFVGGHEVPVVNDPSADPAAIAEAYPDAPFAACWHERGGDRFWRLAGNDEIVSSVIASLGGEDGQFCEEVGPPEMALGERGENFCTIRSRQLFGGNAIEESVIVHLNEYTQWEFAKEPDAGVVFQTSQDTLTAVEDTETPQEPWDIYPERNR